MSLSYNNTKLVYLKIKNLSYDLEFFESILKCILSINPII